MRIKSMIMLKITGSPVCPVLWTFIV